MKLSARIIPVADVDASQRDAMFALMDRYYAHAARERFERDLARKRWVIQVLTPDGELCGFSTQTVLRVEIAGRPARALFSGDTIIDRRHWGDPALAHAWGWLALSLMDAPSDAELYWFLISKGYKTYRYLPLFFHEFYPRYDRPTPAAAQAVIDALATACFPRDYDPRAGLVRGGPDKDRLRPGVAELTPARRRDPHVAYFARRNPRHALGDELCGVAPLRRDNFTAAARRVIGAEPAWSGVLR